MYGVPQQPSDSLSSEFGNGKVSTVQSTFNVELGKTARLVGRRVASARLEGNRSFVRSW